MFSTAFNLFHLKNLLRKYFLGLGAAVALGFMLYLDIIPIKKL